jgi:hypothetical protein
MTISPSLIEWRSEEGRLSNNFYSLEVGVTD